MDPIDSFKRRLDKVLAGNHLWIALGLAAFLLVIVHENNYQGVSLEPRHTGPLLAETAPESAPAALDAIEEPVRQLLSRDVLEFQPGQPEEPAGEILPMPEPEPERTPDYVTEVKSGDNLSLIFDRAGLTPRDVYLVTRSAPQARTLSNLYPGYRLEFFFGEAGGLEHLTVIRNRMESVEITRDDQGRYVAEEIVREPEIRQVFREATIHDSLFLAAQRGGMQAGVTMQLAGIFGGVIDFLMDTREGDTFNLLYEEKFLDGEYIGYGRILAAQFTNQGETYTAVRYVNLDGDVDFYNPQGESMRKAFLRNPVDFTRISSGFSLRRKHPILNTIRAHKGTDYAAPRGTPVVAAGDGRVTFAGRNGSFGKLIVIRHGERFETKYAHLNDYANGVKQGKRVKQGQVIGYVGATGGATGPHLHYEFLMDGVHRNSRTIHNQLPKAESVAASEMQRFREQTQILLSQLEVHASRTRNIAQHSIDEEE